MTTPITASSVQQSKIGTRYIRISTDPQRNVFDVTCAFTDRSYLNRRENWDLYVLLDPADAAELKRLRDEEDSCAETLNETLRLCRVIDSRAGVIVDWLDAHAARIAFERKIGGAE